MIKVTPTVFVVGKTAIDYIGLDKYLKSIGARGITGKENWMSDAKSEGELLIEVGGRLCYRSWFPYDPDRPDCTNENVEKIREGNAQYIANIIKSRHGSVLESVNLTVIFKNVSRVFTAELTRHRAGCAFSQESMRYVRLSRIPMVTTPLLNQQSETFQNTFNDLVREIEYRVNELIELCNLKDVKDFGIKKGLTSLIRRIIPMGVATTIMMTANLRAWRHIMAMRTSGKAEEEIQLVMDQLGPILKEEYPAIFADMNRNNKGEWIFEHEKI